MFFLKKMAFSEPLENTYLLWSWREKGKFKDYKFKTLIFILE